MTGWLSRPIGGWLSGGTLTRQLRVATLRPMPRRTARPPLDDSAADAPVPADAEAEVGARPRAEADLSALPIAGLGRRQVGLILGAIIAVWVIALFARQVGEASAATTRAEEMAAANATLLAEIAAAERELAFIQREPYILQQARGYGLGGPREIPFALEPDAPPLAPDAPGSAALRLGAPTERVAPLDRWLELLFGPDG